MAILQQSPITVFAVSESSASSQHPVDVLWGQLIDEIYILGFQVY